MKDFLEPVREKMEANSFLGPCLNMHYIFWGVGTVLYVLGAFVGFANGIVADLFSAVGIWMMLFGIVLAFVKRYEWGYIIPLAAAAVTNLIVFIILLAHHALSLSSIIGFFAYGALCVGAFMSSDMKKRFNNSRVRPDNNPTIQAGGYICPKCNNVMSKDSTFCSVCGTKRPEQKYCPNCGKPLTENDIFCPGCGTKV